MTFTAKVLTFILFLLSVVFAGMSGVLYSKRLDFKKQYEDTKSALDTKVRNLEAENGKLNGLVAQRNSEYGVLQTEAGKLKSELEAARKTEDVLRQDVKDKTEQNIKVAADKDTMQTLLKTAEARREQVEQELVARKKDLTEARDDLKNARAKISELDRDLAQTKDERDKLAIDRKTLTDRVETFEARIAYLREHYRYDEGLQRVLDVKEPILKDIEGRVVRVDAETGYVFIDKGKSDNVLKDYVFTVYRGDQFVARLRIVEVDAEGNLSAGKVINQKMQVMRGDSVATRLMP